MTELVKIGQFPVYTLSFFVVLAFLWFGFVTYKKGLEYHYRNETLFDLIILSGVLGWILSRLGYVLLNLTIFKENWLRIILLSSYPGYSLIGLVLGVILACLILSRQGEIKLFEGLDLTGLGLMASGAIWQLGLVFSGHISFIWKLPKELLLALLFLLFFVWLWRLEREYRTFSWYRFRKTQARSGFVFGAYLFFLGISMFLLDWRGAIGLLACGVVLIYARSGRMLSHDVKILIKK